MRGMGRAAIWFMVALTGAAAMGFAGSPARAQSNVLFILDASGSMKKKVDGKQRIDIARTSLITSVLALPANVKVGLMIYGARRAKDCTDIQLVSPVQANDRDTVILSMAGLQAKGETPIADSILMGARSLRQFAGQRNSIVVLTDGIEECRGDPCAAASAISRMGIDLKISIIGFTLGRKEREAIECVPKLTGGTYYEAKNSEALVAALADAGQKATAPPVPQVVAKPAKPIDEKRRLRAVVYLSADKPYQEVAGPSWKVSQLTEGTQAPAQPISTSTLSNNLNIDVRAGSYKVETSVGLASGEATAKLTEAEQTTVNVVLNAGIIRGKAYAAENKAVAAAARTRVRWDVTNSSGLNSGTYGDGYTITVPAGAWTVAAQLGNAVKQVSVDVKPGVVVEVPLNLSAGRLELRAKAPNQNGYLQGVRWTVSDLATGETLYGDSSFTEADYNLRAGRYRVQATFGGQTGQEDVEIMPGEVIAREFVFQPR